MTKGIDEKRASNRKGRKLWQVVILCYDFLFSSGIGNRKKLSLKLIFIIVKGKFCEERE